MRGDSMVFPLELEMNTNDFRDYYGSLDYTLHNQFKRAMGRFMQDWLKLAQVKVPKKTHRLELSGHTEVTEEGNIIEGSLIFDAKGDNGFEYAEVQERRCDYHHENGQCHYVQDSKIEMEVKFVTYMQEQFMMAMY